MSIEGDKPVSPQDRKAYQEECARGVSLFKKTLQEYQKSQMPAQKEEFKDVMEKALLVIHETANACLSKELQKEEINLEQDYRKYIANPSPENLDKLNSDLQHFQKNI